MPRPSEPPVDLVAAADPVAAFREADLHGVPLLLRTSGTSRAVVRTPASWVDSFRHVGDLAGIGPDSHLWVPGPDSASMNLFARIQAAYAGATVATGAADATHAALTPAQLLRLLDDGAPRGLTVVVAGDRLERPLAERAVSAGLVVHHYYGAAELSFVAWGSHADDLRPFPGVEVEVRAGEIWVRSGYVCTGYAAAAGPLRKTPDGFATVGDRGTLAAGRLLVHGRPDAVTTGGATVLVADVELVLRPGAQGDVVVVGTPHRELGAVVTVVLTDPDDRGRLLTAAREGLPPAARPRRWLLVAALPLTDGGKVDRDALARLAAAGPADLVGPPPSQAD